MTFDDVFPWAVTLIIAAVVGVFVVCGVDATHYSRELDRACIARSGAPFTLNGGQHVCLQREPFQ